MTALEVIGVSGKSTAVVIPEDILAGLNVKKGDVLHVVETADGELRLNSVRFRPCRENGQGGGYHAALSQHVGRAGEVTDWVWISPVTHTSPTATKSVLSGRSFHAPT